MGRLEGRERVSQMVQNLDIDWMARASSTDLLQAIQALSDFLHFSDAEAHGGVDDLALDPLRLVLLEAEHELDLHACMGGQIASVHAHAPRTRLPRPLRRTPFPHVCMHECMRSPAGAVRRRLASQCSGCAGGRAFAAPLGTWRSHSSWNGRCCSRSAPCVRRRGEGDDLSDCMRSTACTGKITRPGSPA